MMYVCTYSTFNMLLCYTTYRSQASTAQREVQILARLSHKGVVRYHSGWMQEVSDEELTKLQIPASSISTGYSICILLRMSLHSQYT